MSRKRNRGSRKTLVDDEVGVSVLHAVVAWSGMADENQAKP
jgi:hypothetical protein